MSEKETKIDQKRIISLYLFHLDSKTLQEASKYLETVGLAIKPTALESHLRNQIGSEYFSMQNGKIKISGDKDEWQYILDIEHNAGRRKSAENTNPNVSEATLYKRQRESGEALYGGNPGQRHSRATRRE